MADSLMPYGEVLPADQWCVWINDDGTAEVCVSHVDGLRHWYSVKDVRPRERRQGVVASLDRS